MGRAYNTGRTNQRPRAITETVIAGAAKHTGAISRIDRARPMDCFAALIMTTANHRSVVGAVHTTPTG